MPTLYEYFGLIIYFFSNEHEPIHVHAKCENRIVKAEIFIKDGKIIKIKIKPDGRNIPLKDSEIKKFNEILKHYAFDITQKWFEYFVLHKKIKRVKITKRLK